MVDFSSMLSNGDEVLLVDNEGKTGMAKMNAVKLPISNVKNWLATSPCRAYNPNSARLE